MDKMPIKDIKYDIHIGSARCGIIALERIEDMRETVLLCNFTDQAQISAIKRLLLLMKIKIRVVDKKEYLQPVGMLAGILETDTDSFYDGEELETPLMVMSGLTSGRMNQFLGTFRKYRIAPVDLKAIVTPTNQYWNVLQLYEEIKKEHEAMHP